MVRGLATRASNPVRGSRHPLCALASRDLKPHTLVGEFVGAVCTAEELAAAEAHCGAASRHAFLLPTFGKGPGRPTPPTTLVLQAGPPPPQEGPSAAASKAALHAAWPCGVACVNDPRRKSSSEPPRRANARWVVALCGGCARVTPDVAPHFHVLLFTASRAVPHKEQARRMRRARACVCGRSACAASVLRGGSSRASETLLGPCPCPCLCAMRCRSCWRATPSASTNS